MTTHKFILLVAAMLSSTHGEAERRRGGAMPEQTCYSPWQTTLPVGQGYWTGDFKKRCGEIDVKNVGGKYWPSVCNIQSIDHRGAAPKFPSWQYDTTFKHSDPNKDQNWVHEIVIAAEEESDNYVMELGSWIFGIGGSFVSPVAAMIPFAAEKTMEYLGVGEDEEDGDTKVELDLADTVKRILAMTMDTADQTELTKQLSDTKTSMGLAFDDKAAIANDRSLEESKSKVENRVGDLRDRFVYTFDDMHLLNSRPEAAWFLFEPMFALIDTHFQFKIMEFTLKWALASGARSIDDKAGAYPHDVDHSIRETICENMMEFKEGPLRNGKRDGTNTGSLTYQWNKFLEYFNQAFDKRLEAVDVGPTVSVKEANAKNAYDREIELDHGDRRRSHISPGQKFYGPGCQWWEREDNWSVSWVWKDTWMWGSETRDPAATWSASWTASSDYDWCQEKGYQSQGCCGRNAERSSILEQSRKGNVRSGGDCKVTYAGTKPTLDSDAIYRYTRQILDKKTALYNEFNRAYAAMRKTLDSSLSMCKEFERAYEISNLRKAQSVPNGPIARSFLESKSGYGQCMEIQPWLDSTSCPPHHTTMVHKPDGQCSYEILVEGDSYGIYSFTHSDSCDATFYTRSAPDSEGYTCGSRYGLKQGLLMSSTGNLVGALSCDNQSFSITVVNEDWWCKRDEPSYDCFDSNSGTWPFADDPVTPSAVGPRQCFEGCIRTHNDFCLERQLGFPLKGRQESSFNVKRSDYASWAPGGGDESLYVEVWRQADSAFNSAYRGSDKMVPVAQGKFKFTATMTEGAGQMGPIRVRADQDMDMFVYENTDGVDMGELRSTKTLPSKFRPGDLVCTFHRTDDAERINQKRKRKKTRSGDDRRRIEQRLASMQA